MVGVHRCSSFCRNIQALKHGFSLIVPCLTLAMRRSHFSMCNALESGILGLSDNLTAFRVSHHSQVILTSNGSLLVAALGRENFVVL